MSELRKWTTSENRAGQKAASTWGSYFQRWDAIDRAEELDQTSRISEVQDRNQADLLGLENVVGVAPSLKVKAGKPSKKWVLAVLVEKKQPQSKVARADRIPGSVDGVPTDVLEVGKIEALAFDARVRPAVPGFSIGHQSITAGTFGCLVRDIRRCCCNLESDYGCSRTKEECSGDYLILSNNHVLANTNQGKIGDMILQPGPIDGGVFPSDGCAELDRFEPIVLNPFSPPTGYNLVDAACAKVLNNRDITASIIGQIMPTGIDQALVGTPVIKVGRTTQVTTGSVIATNATISVGYGSAGVAQFRHQIITTAMAAGGDSGSLLMDRGLNAVGLLFAGSSSITIHNHIADVETALGVRPLTAPRSS